VEKLVVGWGNWGLDDVVSWRGGLGWRRYLRCLAAGNAKIMLLTSRPMANMGRFLQRMREDEKADESLLAAYQGYEQTFHQR
jgi:hypothetical protein